MSRDAEPDPQEEQRASLLAIHDDERRAHYARDAELLFRHAAEAWTYVRDGRIEHISRAEIVERFAARFKRDHYEEWEDIEPPVIEISEDGTLAAMSDRIAIRLRRTTEDGSAEEIRGIYAGVTVYRRSADGWQSILNVATFDR